MQKSSRNPYKISALSPTFAGGQPPKVSTIDKSKSTKLQSYHIVEDPEQKNSSPSPPHANKNRSSSYEQIGGARCKVFESKVRLKRSQNAGISGSDVSKQINEDSEENKLNFALQYKLNLRRTVFNETKMMIKSKKSKLKGSFQTLEPSKSNAYYEEQNSQKIDSKPSLHSQKHKNAPQRVSSNIDTMYKTIINNHRIPNKPKPEFDELQIAKFPLIAKRKHELTFNYSNLLTAMNLRENSMQGTFHERKGPERKRINRMGKAISRGSNLVQGEINPWETFADQFVE